MYKVNITEIFFCFSAICIQMNLVKSNNTLRSKIFNFPPLLCSIERNHNRLSVLLTILQYRFGLTKYIASFLPTFYAPIKRHCKSLDYYIYDVPIRSKWYIKRTKKIPIVKNALDIHQKPCPIGSVCVFSLNELLNWYTKTQ